MLAHCPASAPRARTSRRACLASTDAPRRDAQNLPRRISPRDGSREHEPRTCAIAQRFLRVPHRSTYAYACTRTRPRSRRPDDSPEEQERRRARRHAARPVTGGRAAVTEAGRPVAARPRKSKVVPMAASGRGYVLGASGEITCRRALRQAVRPTTGGRIWRWRGGRPILAGRPRPIFCAVHACMNAHAGGASPGHRARGSTPRGGSSIVLLTSSAVGQPSTAQAMSELLAYETAPGPYTGSGYSESGFCASARGSRCVIEVS
jgi:hypothetical protein